MSLLNFFDPVITQLRAEQNPEHHALTIGTKIYLTEIGKALAIIDAIWGMDGTAQWFYQLIGRSDWLCENELPILNEQPLKRASINWIRAWAKQKGIPLPW